MKLTNEMVTEYLNNQKKKIVFADKFMNSLDRLNINCPDTLRYLLTFTSIRSRFNDNEEHERMYVGVLDLYLDNYKSGNLFSYIDTRLITKGLMNRIESVDYYSDEPERFLYIDSLENIDYLLNRYSGINVDYKYLCGIYNPQRVLTLVEDKKEYLVQFINSEAFKCSIEIKLLYKTVLQLLYDKKLSVEDIPPYLL